MLVRVLFILALALDIVQGPAPVRAPTVPLNEYGLPVVERLETYRQQAIRERDVALVDLRRFVPGIRLRLVYATPDNPTKRVLYDARRAYLRLPAALALRAAQRDLARRDVGLLVSTCASAPSPASARASTCGCCTRPPSGSPCWRHRGPAIAEGCDGGGPQLRGSWHSSGARLRIL